MIPNYQPIDGKALTFNKGVIEKLFDVTGGIIESSTIFLGEKNIKFAFYYTGDLCEVVYRPGGTTLFVRNHGGVSRTLGWLKETLINRMKELGWEAVITEGKDFIVGRFIPIK